MNRWYSFISWQFIWLGQFIWLEQFIWLGGQQQLNKVNINPINLLGSTVNFQFNVINLGVIIDDLLTMRDRVLRICRTSFTNFISYTSFEGCFQLRPAYTALIHAFASNRLDYCNSLLAGSTDELTNKLQSVLRSVARLVLRKLKFDPIKDDLCDQLHWFPIRQRIQYKLGVLVYKCLQGAAPSYFADISPVGNGSQHLRSATHENLAVPRTDSSHGPRSFAVSGPTLWNLLPVVELETTHIPLKAFKSKLKTYLIIIAYDQWTCWNTSKFLMLTCF